MWDGAGCGRRGCVVHQRVVRGEHPRGGAACDDRARDAPAAAAPARWCDDRVRDAPVARARCDEGGRAGLVQPSGARREVLSLRRRGGDDGSRGGAFPLLELPRWDRGGGGGACSRSARRGRPRSRFDPPGRDAPEGRGARGREGRGGPQPRSRRRSRRRSPRPCAPAGREVCDRGGGAARRDSRAGRGDSPRGHEGLRGGRHGPGTGRESQVLQGAGLPHGLPVP